MNLIRASVTQIFDYIPATRDEFVARLIVQDAVLMRLQVIGECLVQIRALDEEAFRERAPQAWHELIGLRNIISHAYDAIRVEEIWLFIESGELAELAASMNDMNLRTGLPLAES